MRLQRTALVLWSCVRDAGEAQHEEPLSVTISRWMLYNPHSELPFFHHQKSDRGGTGVNVLGKSNVRPCGDSSGDPERSARV